MGTTLVFEDLRHEEIRDNCSGECTKVSVTDSGVLTALTAGKRSLRVINLGTNTAFVRTGGASVTCTANSGHPVLADCEIQVKLAATDGYLFAICASTETADVRLCYTGQ